MAENGLGQGGAVTSGLGSAVIVDGRIVAWFAEPNETTDDLCRGLWFGRWLTWRAKPPELVPLTQAEYEGAMRWAESTAAKIAEKTAQQ